MLITVKREALGPNATAGTLWVDGEYFGFTLELPWKDNKQAVSCIPEGEYPVAVTYSPRFGRGLPLIKDVPNRAGIRIHSANFPHELRGCLAVAKNRIAQDHIQDSLASKLTQTILEAYRRGEAVKISISNPPEQA